MKMPSLSLSANVQKRQHLLTEVQLGTLLAMASLSMLFATLLLALLLLKSENPQWHTWLSSSMTSTTAWLSCFVSICAAIFYTFNFMRENKYKIIALLLTISFVIIQVFWLLNSKLNFDSGGVALAFYSTLVVVHLIVLGFCTAFYVNAQFYSKKVAKASATNLLQLFIAFVWPIYFFALVVF